MIATKPIQNRANARIGRTGRLTDDWVNDCGEAPRDAVGNAIAWLLTPFALVMEKLAERFGWW